MKKEKCAICGRRRGKRMCMLRDQKMICTLCCAEFRDPACEGCPHYASAQSYARSKTTGSPPEIDPEVEEAVDRALELIEQGKLQRGEAIIVELKEDYPQNYMVCYAMGVVHALKGEHDEAITYFDRAITLFPYFIEAYFNKAVAHKETYDVINTLKAFQRVIELGDPEDDIVQNARAFIENIEQNLKTDGMDVDTYIEVGEKFNEACSFMEKGEWEKAINGFQACLSKNKRHVQTYGNLGICYAQIGKKEPALQALDKAIQLDPTYEPAYTNRRMVEALENGEKLGMDTEVKIVEYYKDRFLRRF